MLFLLLLPYSSVGLRAWDQLSQAESFQETLSSTEGPGRQGEWKATAGGIYQGWAEVSQHGPRGSSNHILVNVQRSGDLQRAST